MKTRIFLAAALLVALPLHGCKFIKTSELQKKAAQAGQSGDAERVSTLISESFEAKLNPLMTERAVDLLELEKAIKLSLDDTGNKYGVRAGGTGGAWNFAIKGTATVIEEDRASKAGTAKLDIDGDGKTDAVLQLGPVVKGTALRDFAPSIYDFSQFRDQIEFAKLGRGLNEYALANLGLSSGSLTGKTITFVGAAAIRSAGETPLIVPTSLGVAP
jgi:predicted lipoprotein